MSEQPKALRLADAINYPDVSLGVESAAELRRLHAANQELLEALVDVMFRHVPFSDKAEYAEKARAAIAKATGGGV